MEYFLLVFMVFGIVLALAAPSAVISYAIIFISGIIAGKVLHMRKNTLQFPFVMIIIGFAFGYVAGVYYGSRRIVIVLFILGAIISYKFYDKGVLKH